MKKYLVLLLLVVLLTGCNSNSKVLGCDDCVYSRFTDRKAIGEKLDKFENDYEAVNNKVFLGHVLDNNNKIVKGYVCAIDNGKTFCLEGNVDENKYEANKKILSKVYNKNNCSETEADDEKYYSCTGKISVSISEKGYNYVSISKSDECYVSSDGTTYCFDGNL